MATDVLAELLIAVKGQSAGFERSMDQLDDSLVHIGVSGLNAERKLDSLEEALLEIGVAALESDRKLGVIEGSLTDLIGVSKRASDSLEQISRRGLGGERIKEDADRMVEATARIGSSARAIGTDVAIVGAAITGAVGLAVKFATDQESSFAGVRKTIDATEDQYRALRGELTKLSEAIPVSFNELAGIAEIGGQLGIARENVVDFTEVIARLGESSNLAGEEGATALARFVNVTGLAQDQVGNVASAIVALGNAGASSESEIASMAQRIASTATIAGIAAADVLGVANALSSVGIEAEAGGSAFSKLINEIDTAVARGGASLAKFAEVARLPAAEFAKSFRDDGAKAIETFLRGLRQIDEEGGNVQVVLDELGLTEVRLANAIKASTVAVDDFEDSLTLARSAIQDQSALLEESNKRFETAASRFKIFQNSIENLGAELGTTLLPALTGLADSASETIRTFREWADRNPEVAETLTKIAGVIGVGGVGAGGLLIGMGQLAESAVELHRAFGLIQGTQFAAFLLKLGPGALVAAAGIGALALGTAELEEKFQAVTGDTERLIGANARLAAAGLPQVIRQTGESMSDAANRAEALTKKYDLAAKSSEEIAKATRDAGSSFKFSDEYLKQFGINIENVTRKAEPAGSAVSTLSKTISGLDSPFAKVSTTIKTVDGSIEGLVVDFENASNVMKEIGRLEALTERFKNDKDAVAAFTARIKDLNDNVLPQYRAIVLDIKDLSLATPENLRDLERMSIAFEESGGAVDELFAAAAKADAAAAKMDLFAFSVERLNRAIKANTGKDLREFAEGLGNISLNSERIQKHIDLANASIGDLTVSAQDAADNSLQQMSTAITDLGRDIADLIIDGGKLTDVFEGFGKAILRIISEQVMGKLIAQLGQLLKGIPGLGGLGTILGGGKTGGGAAGLAGLGLGGLSTGLGAGFGIAKATGGGVGGALIGAGAAIPAGIFGSALLAGGGFGASVGVLAAAFSNPISAAIVASIIGVGAAIKIFSKSVTEKFVDEFKRDLGGVDISKEFAGALFGNLGIREDQVEGIRKDLASAPVTLLAALPIAEAQGKLDEFLASLESVGTVFGNVNLRGALEFGLLTKDFTLLNETFKSTFGQSTELTRIFGDDLEKLLVDMGAGFEPLSEKIKKLEDGGASLTEIFAELRPEITQQIIAAEQFGVTLDPLIGRFSELVDLTADLTDVQADLLTGLVGLRQEPERVRDALDNMAASIQFLMDQGASSEQIFQLLGQSLFDVVAAAEALGIAIPDLIDQFVNLDLRQAQLLATLESLRGEPARLGESLVQLGEDIAFLESQGATADEIFAVLGASIIEIVDAARLAGVAIPEFIQDIYDMGQAANDAAEGVGELGRNIGLLSDIDAAAAGVQDFSDILTGAQNDARTLAASYVSALATMALAGIDLATASERAFGLFGNQILDTFNLLVTLGQEIPPQLQFIIDQMQHLELIEIDDQGFATFRDAVTGAAAALTPFERGVAAGAKFLQDMGDEAGEAAGQFVGLSAALVKSGLSMGDALEIAFDQFGSGIADAYNELVKFGQDVPDQLQTIIDAFVELGFLKLKPDGLLEIIDAAASTEDAVNKAADAFGNASQEWREANAVAQEAQAERLRATATELEQASGVVNEAFIKQLREQADRYEAVARELRGQPAVDAPDAPTAPAPAPGDGLPEIEEIPEDLANLLNPEIVALMTAVDNASALATEASDRQVAAFDAVGLSLSTRADRQVELLASIDGKLGDGSASFGTTVNVYVEGSVVTAEEIATQVGDILDRRSLLVGI